VHEPAVEVLEAGADGVRLLRVTGEVDFAAAPGLQPRVPDLVADVPAVVLDLSGVTFFDSAGVRLVDAFARTCGGAGTAFAVAAPPGTIVRRVLGIVGYGPPFVLDDVTTAISTVRRSA
jgi:anti-sigma B factor antagonist